MDIYYANVELSCIKYFEESLEKRSNKITIIDKDNEPRIAENGTKYIRYTLEAEEGIIDPKWKLNDEESC